MKAKIALVALMAFACGGRVELLPYDGGAQGQGGHGGSVTGLGGEGGAPGVGGSADGAGGEGGRGGRGEGGTGAEGGIGGIGGEGGIGGDGGVGGEGGTGGGAGGTGGDGAGGADPGSCNNNVKDGDETDIDCGGSCPACAFSQTCLQDSDCDVASPGCDAALGGCTCSQATGTCVASHCVDQGLDGAETDVDCGGPCPGCGPTKTCIVDDDCSSTLSGCEPGAGCTCDTVSDTCVFSHCFDHHVNSGESDVDCGGRGPCDKCVIGQACNLNFDCLSSACDGMTALCVSNQCIDHHVDGTETDIDCGGGTCAPCGPGKKCNSNFDCETGFCSGQPKTCQ